MGDVTDRLMFEAVTLIGPGGDVVFFAAGTRESELPDWAQGKITAPSVWANPDGPDPAPTPTQSPPTQPAETGSDGGDGSGDPPEREIVGQAPPRHGTGSNKAHWVAFAEANGLDVGDDDTREDIIGACEAAGLVDPA